MPLRYKQKVHLNNGHTRGITAVAFSPAGSHLATAGLDGDVCIWRVSDGRLLYRYSGVSPVLSLIWVPSGDEILLFGTKDGNILMLSVCRALHDFSMRGFCAHKYPVESLAIRGTRIASGAFCELKIWQWREKEQRFVCEVQLPEPPKTSHNEHKEVIVTSLHWTGADEHPLLVVTYMFHGVQIFNARTWESTRTMPLHGKIAHANLSADGQHLAVSNLVRGFDVYRLHNEAPVGVMTHEVGKPRPTPILFIHNGRAVVGGSLVGKVTVWDLHLGKMHTLNIPNGSPVLALSGHCIPGPQPADYRFQIATGIFNEHGDSTCIIWETMELEPHAPRAADTGSSGGLPRVAAKEANAKTTLMNYLMRVVNWTAVGTILTAAAVLFALSMVPPVEK